MTWTVLNLCLLSCTGITLTVALEIAAGDGEASDGASKTAPRIAPPPLFVALTLMVPSGPLAIMSPVGLAAGAGIAVRSVFTS